MVYKPSCVNKFALSKMLQYQQPRSVLLITPEMDACTKHLAAMSPLIRCLSEDSILPKVTKALVQEELEHAYPQIREASHEGMWSRTGWYTQQVCFFRSWLRRVSLLLVGGQRGTPTCHHGVTMWHSRLAKPSLGAAQANHILDSDT